MSKIWFTSDTHFGHDYVATEVRGYSSVHEHDTDLIERWNARVHPIDRVYHLGDFSLAGVAHAHETLKRLYGQIYLCLGNHDRSILRLQRDMKPFVWIKNVYNLKINGQHIWLSHYCHREWPQRMYGTWHLFGHSHGALQVPERLPCMDVGVDCHNFAPISYEEVRAEMERRVFEPQSHHEKQEL